MIISLVSWKPYRTKAPLIVYLTQTTDSGSQNMVEVRTWYKPYKA